MKLSKRLLTVANYIANESYVVDAGCDHALLDIYLTKIKNCQCLAIDKSASSVEKARLNIEKSGLTSKICLKRQAGLLAKDLKTDTIVCILGMGYKTILAILKSVNLANASTLIIQSNNNQFALRKEICKLGFYIYYEEVIYEHDKFHVIISFKKGHQRYHLTDYLFGPIILKNKEHYQEYFNFLFKKLSKRKAQVKRLKEKLYLNYEIYLLKKVMI